MIMEKRLNIRSIQPIDESVILAHLYAASLSAMGSYLHQSLESDTKKKDAKPEPIKWNKEVAIREIDKAAYDLACRAFRRWMKQRRAYIEHETGNGK
jgi:hypothetical protein